MRPMGEEMDSAGIEGEGRLEAVGMHWVGDTRESRER